MIAIIKIVIVEIVIVEIVIVEIVIVIILIVITVNFSRPSQNNLTIIPQREPSFEHDPR
jgi:hypothetical protein